MIKIYHYPTEIILTDRPFIQVPPEALKAGGIAGRILSYSQKFYELLQKQGDPGFLEHASRAVPSIQYFLQSSALLVPGQRELFFIERESRSAG